jgi:protein-S-isoprenylcysteine O-methyltransferase Ste14
VRARLIARYIVGEAMAVVGTGVALLWSAGRIVWWPAWASLAVMVAWLAAMDIVIFRSNPDLLAERLGPGKGAKAWDKAIMSIMGPMDLARYIVAGLDQRYGWTGGFPLVAQLAGLALSALGLALFVWAMASNRFFSKVVRIQSERGHAVATGGPYRYVRHPAYVGGIVYGVAVSILLASWWAVILGCVSASLLVLRTALEDRTLATELSGYGDYSGRVRHRLLPGVW